MSNELTVSQRQEIIAQEAEANNQLMMVVNSMKEYRDSDGNGPEEKSLKGIMMTVHKRIILHYGLKIDEMPPEMLLHVKNTKLDLSLLIKNLIKEGRKYKDLKATAWAFIESRAKEYHAI